MRTFAGKLRICLPGPGVSRKPSISSIINRKFSKFNCPLDYELSIWGNLNGINNANSTQRRCHELHKHLRWRALQIKNIWLLFSNYYRNHYVGTRTRMISFFEFLEFKLRQGGSVALELESHTQTYFLYMQRFPLVFTQQGNWMDFASHCQRLGFLSFKRLLYWAPLKGITVEKLNSVIHLTPHLVFFYLILLLESNQKTARFQSNSWNFPKFYLMKTSWICRLTCLPQILNSIIWKNAW